MFEAHRCHSHIKFTGFSKMALTTVTPWALLVPVFGMSASSLLLAEPLPLWKLIAASLVLLGLLLNLYYSKTKLIKPSV